MAFETEIARYHELLPELLRSSERKFAVIHDRDFLGVFDSNSEAYAAGLKAFGVVSFLLRPVSAKQQEICIPALELGLLRAKL